MAPGPRYYPREKNIFLLREILTNDAIIQSKPDTNQNGIDQLDSTLLQHTADATLSSRLNDDDQLNSNPEYDMYACKMKIIKKRLQLN